MELTIERRFLKRIHLVLFTFLFFNFFQAQQQLIELSGIIKDIDNHKGVTGAHIQVENTQDIASTDQDGNFSLRTRVKIPFRVIIKKEGFTSQTVEILSLSNKITVELNPQNTIINEVVISASLRAKAKASFKFVPAFRLFCKAD